MPGPQKLPPSLRQQTGRHEGVDSGGRVIEVGPDLGYEAPEMPDYLDDDAAQMWQWVVDELKGADVLRRVDAAALAACCETYSRWRQAVRERHSGGVTTLNRFGDAVRAPWVGVEDAAAKSLQSWLREFGLTPSAAANLGTANGSSPEGNDPFSWADE